MARYIYFTGLPGISTWLAQRVHKYVVVVRIRCQARVLKSWYGCAVPESLM